jgi:hypothetical protein
VASKDSQGSYGRRGWLTKRSECEGPDGYDSLSVSGPRARASADESGPARDHDAHSYLSPTPDRALPSPGPGFAGAAGSGAMSAAQVEVALVVPMRLVWIGMIVGSAVGGYLPVLWGGDLFSFSSLILSGVGGILGIWLGNRFSE